MIVALGEPGAWLLSPEGRVLARFSEPTHRVVPSDHGDRALLLAQRGEVFRVSRLDLLAKRVLPWCDARFDRFAPDFDGSIWFVARGDTVYAIDATASQWQHLWKVDERAATAGAVRRNPMSLSVWFAGCDGSNELWSFELPSLTLRQRQAIGDAGAHIIVGTISAGGKFACWQAKPAQEPTAGVFVRGTWTALTVPATAPPAAPIIADDWVAVPSLVEHGTTIHLFDATAFKERARIELVGAQGSAGVRFQGERLVVFDGCGRLLVVSLTTGALVRDYRVA